MSYKSARRKSQSAKAIAFQTFKYAVYLFLVINTVLFLQEGLGAYAYAFRDGLTFANMFDAFATFVDSMGWLILLLVFELQTYILPDDVLRGKIKWLLNGVITVAYGFIVAAFFGYWESAIYVYEFEPIEATDACALVGTYDSVAIGYDNYTTLTPETCKYASQAPLYLKADAKLVADAPTYSKMRKISAVDVLNSASWLLVVLVLWLDVALQVARILTEHFFRISMAIKAVLYSTLIVACGYWFYLEDWLAGWDALLWLLAFIATELNLFNWHEEVLHEEEAAESATALNTEHLSEI